MWTLVCLNSSGIVMLVLAFTTQALANAALTAFNRMAGNERHPRGWTAQVMQAVGASDTAWSHNWK
jgi:hypothetical protein